MDAEIASAVLHATATLDVRSGIFRMVNVLDGDPMLREVVTSAAANGFTYSLRRSRASYYLELPHSFEEYLARRTSKFRNHLNRTQKKTEGAGATIVEVTSLETSSVRHAVGDRASQLETRHGTVISAVDERMRLMGTREADRSRAALARIRTATRNAPAGHR